MILHDLVRKPSAVLLLLLAGALLLGQVHAVLESGAWLTDTRVYYHGAQQVWQNPDAIYHFDLARFGDKFTNPPASLALYQALLLFPLEQAFVISAILSYCWMIAACWLWLRVAEKDGVRISPPDKLVAMALSLAAWPAFHAAFSGQVITLVLFLSVLSVYCVVENRPGLAGLCLALGFWIKLYPVLLAFVFLGTRAGRRSLVWAACAGALIPLVISVVVPLHLYVVYFFEFLPHLAGVSLVHILCQSAAAFYLRLGVPFSQMVGPMTPDHVPFIVRVLILGIGAASCFFLYFIVKDRAPVHLWLVAWLMALIAPLSPLSWGHAYVFAWPFLILVFLHAEGSGFAALSAVIAAYLLFEIPVWHQFAILEHAPNLVQDLVYSRYLFALIALYGLAVLLILRDVRQEDREWARVT